MLHKLCRHFLYNIEQLSKNALSQKRYTLLLGQIWLFLTNLFHGAYESEVDFSYSIFDECYGNTLPENLSFYFDYAAFARDLFINDYLSVDADGKVHVFSRY